MQSHREAGYAAAAKPGVWKHGWALGPAGCSRLHRDLQGCGGAGPAGRLCTWGCWVARGPVAPGFDKAAFEEALLRTSSPPAARRPPLWPATRAFLQRLLAAGIRRLSAPLLAGVRALRLPGQPLTGSLSLPAAAEPASWTGFWMWASWAAGGVLGAPDARLRRVPAPASSPAHRRAPPAAVGGQ